MCQNGCDGDNDSKKLLTNHGMLVGEHPGAPSGPDTIVGRVFPLALYSSIYLVSLLVPT